MAERVLEVKKLHGCALLCLSDGQTLKVPASVWRERKITEGEFIDIDDYRAFILKRGPAHAMDSAVRLLSVSDRTEKELRRRLDEVGYPAEVIDGVIGRLYELRLINDQAYAEYWAKSRMHRAGPQKLQMELVRRGVDRETASAAVNISEEDQLRDAVRLTGKYLGRTHGGMDRSLYSRTLAMLARHGYSADIAKKAIAAIAAGEDETGQDDYNEPVLYDPLKRKR